MVSEYDANTASRAAFSSSLPIDTQVSVTTTSAPVTNATSSAEPVADPPVCAPIELARSNIASLGR